MARKNVENLLKLAKLKAAMAQSDLAPIEAEILGLEKQLEAVLASCDNSLPDGPALIAKVRHDQWREQTRQSLSLAIAVAQENAWPARKAAAKHHARVKVLEELRDRSITERRGKLVARTLGEFFE
mgnify:CR=1 FL=1